MSEKKYVACVILAFICGMILAAEPLFWDS